MRDIFRFVKTYVTTNDVAIHYGFRPNRSDLICCPFHNDSKPSMKVDRRYFCFGCGAQGDAIDFVSEYFGIGLRDAAEKIATDFGISMMPEVDEKIETPGKRNKSKAYQLNLTLITRHLLRYKDMISIHTQELAPKSMDDEWSDAFVDEINANVRVTYLIDGLLFGSKEECMEFYNFYKEEVDEIVRSMEAGERRNHRKIRTK